MIATSAIETMTFNLKEININLTFSELRLQPEKEKDRIFLAWGFPK